MEESAKIESRIGILVRFWVEKVLGITSDDELNRVNGEDGFEPAPLTRPEP